MREEERMPISMGGASIIIIFTAFLLSVIIIFMISQAYKVYKSNEEYIVQTHAFYVADSAATTKRALIEQQLYQIYFSKANIAYDKERIIKAIKDIKGVEIIETEEKNITVRYTERINTKENLVVELVIEPIEKGLEVERFTIVNKWQVEKV